MGDTESTTLVTQVFSEGGLEQRLMYCECTNLVSILLTFNDSIRKSFKGPQTATEWSRFRKYAQRVRELRMNDYSDPVPSPGVFSVVQSRAINEPLFPNLETLDLWRIEERFIPFVPLFLSPWQNHLRQALF